MYLNFVACGRVIRVIFVLFYLLNIEGVDMNLFDLSRRATRRLFGAPQKADTTHARVIVESNGIVRTNYDNEEVRRDLLREMRKFEDFKVERK
ncbi:hypothetical protein [Kingella bonacorsii]|jgi:hypothetical protein|uniref:Uncharacterized protein n=1 Tax=Kingella bonacorsii TaxID=2796361 RepID=A0ABS1BY35_9NEIS|nr:hypothetical protein [Kingella bonacorsii]MBK0397540.1 hypothetical protein [Kingella bonacorsii]DAY03438.1 MAG TPA: hypothetical protein [Caudoviricetes sp.]